MRYLILGAGGTGGCLGAYLARAGHDVVFIARGAHLAAMRENGLTLHSSRIGSFTLPHPQLCTAEEYTGTPDVIFVCVKYYSIPEMLPLLARAAGPETLVIPILNVFGTGELLSEQLPGAEVLDGCIYIYGMIESPGVVSQPSPIFRVFFGYRPGQTRHLSARARETEAELRGADIDACFTEDIRREALRKFSFVSPMGAAGLYCHARGADFLRTGEAQDTFLTLVDEVGALGAAMGIDVGDDLRSTNMAIMRSLTPDSTTSMQRDALAGHPTEMDGLVHRVCALARRFGAQTPVYDKISAWAKANGIR
ncbi:MAG: ketopantoate reductase family protein [Eubacteriales bacterium]